MWKQSLKLHTSPAEILQTLNFILNNFLSLNIVSWVKSVKLSKNSMLVH